MRYLFDCWDKISSKIKKSPRIFLFFDYDGTLTPIVSTPEKATFPKKSKELIRRLIKNQKFKVAIISGRSLKDVKSMVGLKGIIYAGNHGLEIAKPRKVFKNSPLKTICIALKKGLGHIKGVRVEDKGCTLSVHFRLVRPEHRILVKNIFYRTLQPYIRSKRVKASSGKMVLEVRPSIDWHKGKAVLYLLSKLPCPDTASARGRRGVWTGPVLPIYLGDDVTDIDAFRAIKGKGISIFVGSSRKNMKADYFLKNTFDVKKFIERLFPL